MNSTAIVQSRYLEVDVGYNILRSGGCSTWSYYLLSDLFLKSFQYVPSKMIYFVAKPISSSVVGWNYLKYSCSSSDIISEIISYLTTYNSTKLKMECSGHVIVAQYCGKSRTPSTCIDCEDLCSNSNELSVISPCNNNNNTINGDIQIRLMAFEFNYPQQAPVMQNVRCYSTASTITVSSVLSSDGLVYCGGWTNGSLVLSLNQLYLNSFSVRASNNSQVNVTINNLNPSTQYDIYCFTESTLGIQQSFSTVMKNMQKIYTKCCNILTVSFTSLSIAPNVPQFNLISLQLLSKPSVSFSVSILVYKYSENSEDTGIVGGFVPSSIVFGSKRSSLLSFSSSLNPLSSGKYKIVGFSYSQSDIIISYSNNVNSSFNYQVLNILSSEEIPPTPSLLEARFSSDGSYLSILFDYETNMGNTLSSFDCSDLFNFSCSSSSRCRWNSRRNVFAFIDNDVKCASPESPFSIANNANIKAKCLSTNGYCDQSNWDFVSRKVISIKKPTTIIAPKVSITSPSAIGGCDSLYLDISSSSGSGGRDWSIIAVNTSIKLSGSKSIDLSPLQNLLNKFKISPPTIIPVNYLPRGFLYNFQVTLCNFLGGCGVASKQIIALDDIIPSVTIAGPQLLSINVFSTLLAQTDIVTSSCGNSSRSFNASNYKYSWSLSIGNIPLLELSSTSRDQSKFKLSPYNLKAPLVYTLMVIVTDVRTNKFSSAAILVSIQQGKLISKILGRSQRTVSVNSTIVLDGSSSYDQDRDISLYSGSAAGLLFKWDCRQLSDSSKSDCSNGDFVVQNMNDFADKLQILVPATAVVNSIAFVSLVVTDSTNTRSASTSVTMSIIPDDTPHSKLSSNAKDGIINNDERLIIEAGVIGYKDAFTEYEATWLLEGYSLNLTMISLTPTRVPLIPSAIIESFYYSSQLFLAVKTNLLPIGVTFSFTLALTNTMSANQTKSAIEITVNAPPTPGFFLVKPDVGVELFDLYTFYASQWQDSDKPVTYQFGYFLDDVYLSQQSRSLSSSGEWYMPAGDEAFNYSILCSLIVYDAYGASSANNLTVVVKPASSCLNISAVYDYITNDFSKSSGNSNQLKRTSAISSYLINKNCNSNCLKAGNCTALHRNQCDSRSATCGNCLSSFIGDEDNADTQCISATTSTSSIKSNSSCRSVFDCVGYEQCVKSMCVVPSKSCGGGCNQGQCIFKNIDNDNLVGVCQVGSEDCYAICVCYQGYYGETCSFSSYELEDMRRARDTAIGGLKDLINVEDQEDDAAILNWISILVKITQHSYAISEDGITKSYELVDYITSSLSNNGVYYTKADIIQDIINNVLSTAASNGSINTNNGVSMALDSMANYNTYILSQAVPGQDAVTITKRWFRSINQIYAKKLTTNDTIAVLKLPQNPIEQFNGKDQSEISLSISPKLEDSLKVSVSSIRASAYGTSSKVLFISNPVNLQLSSFPCDKISKNCLVDLVLQNSELIRLNYSKSENITFNCLPNLLEYKYKKSANGFMVNATCNGTYDGDITVQCPSRVPESVCKGLNGNYSIDSIGCQVKYFNAYNSILMEYDDAIGLDLTVDIE
eukprot:gene5442-7535_t